MKNTSRNVFNNDMLFLILALSICLFFGTYFLKENVEEYYLYVVLSSIYWLCIAVSIFCVYFIFKSSKLQNTYNQGGSLYHWYDIKLNQRGTLWLIRVFEKLLDKGLVNANKLIIASPSANKGTYEKRLYEFLIDKGIHSKFIVTDINIIDCHEENVKNENSEFVFLNESNDAKDIKSIIKKAGEDKVDIILDFEGCLWYIKEFNWYKGKRCADDVLNMLKKYNEVLNQGGMIIVDNTKTIFVELVLRQLSNLFSHLNLGLPEHSTGWYLQKIYNKKEFIEYKEYIDQNFTFNIVDIVNEKGKDISVLCFKKK